MKKTLLILQSIATLAASTLPAVSHAQKSTSPAADHAQSMPGELLVQFRIGIAALSK